MQYITFSNTTTTTTTTPQFARSIAYVGITEHVRACVCVRFVSVWIRVYVQSYCRIYVYMCAHISCRQTGKPTSFSVFWHTISIYNQRVLAIRKCGPGICCVIENQTVAFELCGSANRITHTTVPGLLI